MYHLTAKKPANFNKLYVGITRATLNGVKLFMNAKGADEVNKLLKAAGQKGIYDRAGALDKASKERTKGIVQPNAFAKPDGLTDRIEYVKDAAKSFLDQIKEAAKVIGKEIGLTGGRVFGEKVVKEIVDAGLENEIIITNEKLQRYKDDCIYERDVKLELEARELQEKSLSKGINNEVPIESTDTNDEKIENQLPENLEPVKVVQPTPKKVTTPKPSPFEREDDYSPY